MYILLLSINLLSTLCIHSIAHFQYVTLSNFITYMQLLRGHLCLIIVQLHYYFFLKVIVHATFQFILIFSLSETITLTEEHIQAGLRDGSLRSLDEGHVEVISHGHIIEDGQVIEAGDGVMSEEEEEEEDQEEGAEEEEEEELIAMEHLSDSVVEEELSVGEELDMQMTG